MIVDGKKIANRLKEEVKSLVSSDTPKTLGIMAVGANQVTENYLARKIAFGQDVGIAVEVVRFAEDVSEEELMMAVKASTFDGLVVQLPLPSHIDKTRILGAIPLEQDVDMLNAISTERAFNRETMRLPPVVAALAEILKEYDVNLSGKTIVVVGTGNLVGKPVSLWLQREGYAHDIVDQETLGAAERIAAADVIISGTGVPGLIRPDMVREGSVLIDAGTATQDGQLRGDIDPACGPKASLAALVPGGVGPITIAALFRNLFL